MTEKQPDNSVHSLFDSCKRLVGLYVDSAKIAATDKVTTLFSVVAIFLVGMLLSLLAVVFLVLALVSLLDSVLNPCWTFLIVTGILLLLVGLLVVFRVQLVYNPVARFVSKLFLNPPKS